jgi:ferric-dicitrate binding protein FerR (iron transport regulator)
VNQPDPDKTFSDLLKLAGERDLPSSAGMARARAAAEQAWQHGLNEKATRPVARRWLPWSLAAAAGVAVAVVALVWLRAEPRAPVLVATISASQGEVRVQGAPLSAQATRIFSGTLVESFDGRIALAIGDALSLRMDRHTRLRFDGEAAVTLLAGNVYVDSGGINTPTTLSIVTPVGTVRHVGTQFQVRVAGEGTEVRVREGRVMLNTPAAAVDIGAGDFVVASGGAVRVLHGQDSFGAHWDWATATSPAFDSENRPLAEFLAWLAREHGWQLQYADAALQARSREIRLHGSLSGLDAPAMLERVALITGVPLSARNGVLSVGPVRRP